MTLLRQKREDIFIRGKEVFNFFLAWHYEGKIHYIMIKPTFKEETKFLKMNSVEVPRGEPFAKYV